MVRRFLVLSVWVVVPAVIAITVYVVIYFVQHPHVLNERTPKVPGPSTAVIIAIAVGSAVIADVLLTFVMPALALSTESVRDATRLGIGIIARTWPTSAWYVVAPGVTVLAALYFAPIPNVVCAILLVAAGLVSLWVKGATVAFYQRVTQGRESAATSPEPPPPS